MKKNSRQKEKTTTDKRKQYL